MRVLEALISQVHGPDPKTTSSLQRAVSHCAYVQRGTVTSLHDLRAASMDVETVTHLAAEPGTAQSMYEIDRYVEANIGGTAKVMDLLTNEPHGVRRVVVASSRSVYGEGAYRSANGTVVYPPHRSDTAVAEGDFAVRDASGEQLESPRPPKTPCCTPRPCTGSRSRCRYPS